MSLRALKYLPSLIILSVVLLLMQGFSFYTVHKLKKANTTNDLYFVLNNTITELKFDIADADAINTRVVYDEEKDLLNEYELSVTNARNHVLSIEKSNPQEELKPAILSLRIMVNQYVERHKEIIRLMNTGKKEQARSLASSDDYSEMVNKVNASCTDLQNKYIEYQRVLSNKNSTNIWYVQFFTFLLALLISMYMTYNAYSLTREREREIEMQHSLREAEQRAKKSALIKEQFMANMSHEIRTPLNAIIGFTQRLLKTPLTQEQTHYLEAVQSSGENLLNIVNDILDFSKIEAGMLRLEIVRFHLPSLLENIKTLFNHKASEKLLAIQVKISDNVPQWILGDSYRLSQILMNLMSNAIKFTEKGFIAIHVNCNQITDETCTLSFAVKDSGIGISADKINLIFERFEQAELDTNRKYGGTGLGLSIVKQIVELMQGEISVKSDLAGGSEFTVELPFGISHAKEGDMPPIGQPHMSSMGSQSTVLIVEDNPLNLRLIELLLQDWNLGFDSAENGYKAILKLKEKKYQLILMDIQMPDLNGYETTQYIRQTMKLDIPIVAMTAHALEGEKEKCLSMGMNDYTTKPINEHQLYDLLMQFLPISRLPQNDKGNPQQTASIISLQYLEDLLHHDKSKIAEILSNYRLDVPEYLNKLIMALSSKDFETIRFCAHRLQSSMSFTGLDEEVGDALREIERLASLSSQSDEIQSIVSHIAPLIQQSVQEVNQFISLQDDKVKSQFVS